MQSSGQALLSEEQKDLLLGLNPAEQSCLSELIDGCGQQFAALDAVDQISEELLNETSAQLSSATASKYGGSYAVPPTFVAPIDREGEPMEFLGQINFSQVEMLNTLLPSSGLLMLFLSKSFVSYKPKERHWYKFFWLTDEVLKDPTTKLRLESSTYPEKRLIVWNRLFLPEQAIEQTLQNGMAAVAERFNQLSHSACSLLFGGSKKATIARVQAAFHANGVSFHQSRMLDPHYQHLVETGDTYVNLWTSSGLALMKTGVKGEIYICVRQEDLTAALLEKCLPVIM